MHGMKLRFLALILIGTSHCTLANSLSKIAIDIGHSTASPGAISARGKSEFEFNVALARVLRQMLMSHQIDSFLIGEDGKMLDLKQRTAKAHADSASLFLSIHHDSAQAKYLKQWRWQNTELSYADNFSGFSLFVSRQNPQLKKSLECARMIGQALKQVGFNPSSHHAEPISGENRQWADKDFGVYYYDELIVLKTAKIPAVLVEAGVIVNRDEEQNLQKDSTKNRIASAITQGVTSCMELE